MFEPVTALRTIGGQVFYFCCWLFVTVCGILLQPSASGHGTHQELGLPPCPCVLIFNRPCPGCGLTTSFSALLHGRFRDAFKAHFFGPLLYAIFTVSAITSFAAFLRGRRFTINQRPIQNFMLVFTIVFVAFGVIRFFLDGHYQTATESMMAAGYYPR